MKNEGVQEPEDLRAQHYEKLISDFMKDSDEEILLKGLNAYERKLVHEIAE